MLAEVGVSSLAALAEKAVPGAIYDPTALNVFPGQSEAGATQTLADVAEQNTVLRSFIGQGYYDCVTPPVIRRNIFENPGWYTQYTPYQAEIAQGRLRALLLFQTMVADLTALPLSNASLLDEATAAAEAMAMCLAAHRGKRRRFVVEEGCHPQTIEVVKTRAEPLGIDLVVCAKEDIELTDNTAGVLVQYPTTDGRVVDYSDLCTQAKDKKIYVACATDLLALTVLRPPGEFGADIAIGSSQRFGVPLGYGGPHAAFMSASESFRRQVPGRVVGISKDSRGREAYRLALQTREQHIRREKATSNICTAQVLLAIMAGMYAVYHGPNRLTRLAERVRGLTRRLRQGLSDAGKNMGTAPVFDTLRVAAIPSEQQEILTRALAAGMNLRAYDNGDIGVSLDECTSETDVEQLIQAIAPGGNLSQPASDDLGGFRRTSSFLTHQDFHSFQSEHEFLRFVKRLESRDISLTSSMIPLGSCTMKLNAAAEMFPVSWPEFAKMHPLVPKDQATGYTAMVDQLGGWLADITGFAAVSFMPNAGAQGEYAGLLAIRGYHKALGDSRSVCLIPTSAHGTNPASAVMCGFKVVAVRCDDAGNVDVEDLRTKVDQHKDNLAALMITYPSTHGVFELQIKEICSIVHDGGGMVYLDGANMNAQLGLSRPGDYGADVCHLNLHKTFCIPHGGGGPGMGPIAVNDKLADYLPGGEHVGAISAAEYGSASILPISWMYIAMMGSEGLRRSSQVAILNANYMAKRLSPHFPVVYSGPGGVVAHEFIIDLRPFKKTAGLEVDDVAKRLMDFGYHAPTMSFPVAGTLMIEPTESESKSEVDRFCDAMVQIREEIRALEEGRGNIEDSALRHAPHTMADIADDEWNRSYSRRQAAFALPYLDDHKVWPAVNRIDNAYGDRHLICTCPSVEDVAEV